VFGEAFGDRARLVEKKPRVEERRSLTKRREGEARG